MVASSILKKSGDWVSSTWQSRMVQLSVYAGVMFYVVANPAVFKFMERFLPSKITHMNQLVVHSVLFVVLVYFGTTIFLDPILSQLGLR
jgi:hypothetical protein